MPQVVYIGVRHHSPACARHVAQVITTVRPAWVLVEGPSDVNDRMDELLADHQLPVAVFSSFTHDDGVVRSWAPLCEYSPEWVALRTGRQVGAGLKFIDLPAWHRAFDGRENRYSDADARYAEALGRLTDELGADTSDALWDHLFEIAETDDLGPRLDTYFDLLRGETETDERDTAREAYMARWVASATARDDGPVVVVTGGFHRAALIRLVALHGDGADRGAGDGQWPQVPPAPADAHGNPATSYLVPYSFRRLDAFTGYQSGMPSPAYYQDVWDVGPGAAGDRLVERVARRLRSSRQPVSTADLVAARTMTAGLAGLRDHPVPTRTDVLDGLASTLVTEALDVPLPWAARGPLRAGTDPVVVEMVAALSGDRVGRLAPGTPLPPLVDAAVTAWREQGLDTNGRVELDLVAQVGRSRVCHQARVLGIPRFVWRAGPLLADPFVETLTETWQVNGPVGDGGPAEDVLVALIEAGTYGHDLLAAATAALTERLADTSGGPDASPAAVLVDAVLVGAEALTGALLAGLASSVRRLRDVAETGKTLAVTLMLWRYGDHYGVRDLEALAALVDQTAGRLVWLLEGVRGGAGPADPRRLAAVVALRDATKATAPTIDAPLRAEVVSAMGRLASDPSVPPDLRGAALGVLVSLGERSADPVTTLRAMAGPTTAGDWLAGLFAVARDEVADLLLDDLDWLLAQYDPHQFLVALPALRGAFAYLPPRERARLAEQLMARRGLVGTGRTFLRLTADPAQTAAAQELEARVRRVLIDAGLWELR